MADEEIIEDISAIEIDEDKLIAVDDNFKVPEKKTVGQLLQADADDEALRKYKESLIGDPLKASAELSIRIVKLEIVTDEGQHLDYPVDKVIKKGMHNQEIKVELVHTLKAGTKYRLFLHFKIETGIVHGFGMILTVLKKVFKKYIKVDSEKIPIGSYPASNDFNSFEIRSDTAPTNRGASGTYNVVSKLYDDDKSFDVKLSAKMKIE